MKLQFIVTIEIPDAVAARLGDGLVEELSGAVEAEVSDAVTRAAEIEPGISPSGRGRAYDAAFDRLMDECEWAVVKAS